MKRDINIRSYLIAVNIILFFRMKSCTVFIDSFIYRRSFLFVCFYGHTQDMEVPRLGAKSELQLPAYTTATAMWDLSHVCDVHHSSRKCWLLDPLSEARD